MHSIYPADYGTARTFGAGQGLQEAIAIRQVLLS